MAKKVLIVGAGIGGLSTALRLTQRGYSVQIIEKNSKAGGRLNQIKKDGFTFDTGPSFFSMSYEFEELAKDGGMESLPFAYRELDPLYTVNFRNSPTKYYLYKDLKKLSAQFLEAEPNFEKVIGKYLTKCSALFHDTIDVVIKRNFNSMLEYLFTLLTVNPQHLPVLFRKFDKQVNRYFVAKEAKQIISLVAFFLGRTPFDTNAIYTLLSYTELVHDGYYNVKGGMYKIVEGFVNELEKRGVVFVYNTEIENFQGNRKSKRLNSLIDTNGNKHEADIFIINSDAASFRGKVFGRRKYEPKILDALEWTMGYLTIYIGIKGKLKNVDHHNYYLGNNFDEYAKDVQTDPRKLEKPYYYVNVLSKHNEECAPEGCESLFFVCPVPDLRYKPNWDDKDEIVASIIEDFSNQIGYDISANIVTKTVYTPLDWQNNFNLYRGSGLGLSHHLLQIGAFRPKNYDEIFKNTFYVGASTHPGAGLPMAVISSKLATQRVEEYVKK